MDPDMTSNNNLGSQPHKHPPVSAGNGGQALKQKSLSSMSSCDSDCELLELKKMPILDTSYSPTNLIPPKDATISRSAGDLVIAGITPANPSLVEDHIVNIPEKETPPRQTDVPDSVPTRDGKKSTLYDDELTKPKDDIGETSEHSNNESRSSTSDKGDRRSLFCEVFCAMLDYEHLLTRYTIIDLFLNLGSIGLYVFDLVTDLLNAFSYLYRENDDQDNLFYFSLTMVVIIVPSLVMHAFSAWWEVEDNQYIKKEKTKHKIDTTLGWCYCIWVIISHICQLGPIYRYIRTIRYGIKSRKKEVEGNVKRWKFYDKKYKGELSDVNFIRLMESFLEAAPQLVLQIFIMIRTTETPPITVVSCCVSLFGLSISFVAYERALRNTLERKVQISVIASIVMFIYRTCTILSRVFALALLLNINFWAWIALFVGHWFLMGIWIAVQKTTFCQTKAKEYVYDAVIGFCYNFAYLNVHHDSRNRCRMIIYYILMFLENLAMAFCWFYLRHGSGGSIIATLQGRPHNPADDTIDNVIPDNAALAFLICVICLFILGIMFLIVYYFGLHPSSKGADGCIQGSEDTTEPVENPVLESQNQVVRMRRCGDNYRTNRGAPQFRSWHSASLQLGYSPSNDTPMTPEHRRPVSDIITPSPSIVYEIDSANDRFSSGFDVNSATCSCYSLRKNLVGYYTIGNTPNDPHDSPGRWNPREHERHPVSSGKVLSEAQHRKQNITSLKEAEEKRQYVAKLILQKQKEKRELEHRQAILRLNLEKRQLSSYSLKRHGEQNTPFTDIELHEVFNRKQRAKNLYAKQHSTSASLYLQAEKTQSAVPERKAITPIKPSVSISGVTRTQRPVIVEPTTQHHVQIHPVRPRHRLHSSDGATSSRMLERPVPQMGSGTFPRYLRSSHSRQLNPNPCSRQPHNLKPISENKLTLHSSSGARDYSASLANLTFAQPRSPLARTVPRAMSFTVSKNEVVESIESSL